MCWLGEGAGWGAGKPHRRDESLFRLRITHFRSLTGRPRAEPWEEQLKACGRVHREAKSCRQRTRARRSVPAYFSLTKVSLKPGAKRKFSDLL